MSEELFLRRLSSLLAKARFMKDEVDDRLSLYEDKGAHRWDDDQELLWCDGTGSWRFVVAPPFCPGCGAELLTLRQAEQKQNEVNRGV